MKGHLPKAYLRIDPNLDHTHPYPGLFVKLLCAAARQPRRGLFKDVRVLERCLGRTASRRLLERGDLIEREDGLWVDGWDIWQEGDMTVGERMARYRNKLRNGSVTESPPIRISPSETVRQQGSKAGETENERSFSPGSESGNGNGTLTESEYADVVWSKFLERSGQPATRIMSPVEFATLKGWLDAGIPLRIVLRGMEDTKGKGSSLAYYAPSVRDAYDYYRQAMHS